MRNTTLCENKWKNKHACQILIPTKCKTRLSSSDEFTRFLSCRWLYQYRSNHHVNLHFAPMLFVTSSGQCLFDVSQLCYFFTKMLKICILPNWKNLTLLLILSCLLAEVAKMRKKKFRLQLFSPQFCT